MAEQSSRSSQMSWTITGASAETREKVKAAAEASGMTIRAWVNHTLNAAASGELVPRNGPAPVAIDPKALDDLTRKLDELLSRLPENTKAAEKAANQAISAAVLKALASGFQETSRAAKMDPASKPIKKKRKKRPLTAQSKAAQTSTPTRTSGA